MSKIPGPPLQVESLARWLGGCIFSCSRGNFISVYSFFNILFWYFYVSKFGEQGLLYDIFYLSKRVSLCSRRGFFLYSFAYFVPFGVIENRVTKIKFKYFNQNCDNSSCPDCLFLSCHKRVSEWIYSCLTVKELLAQSRRKSWTLSDCNWTRTHNHLVHTRTLNHLAKLTSFVTTRH